MDGILPLLRRALCVRLPVLLVVLCAVLALGAPARATTHDPSERWPSDGPAVRLALALATEQWGMEPCHGDVQVGWLEELDRSVAARATWANDAGPYAAPLRNVSCEIALNPAESWDWPKLCTIVVHEAGHLDGHDHTDVRDDVMYPGYVAPLPACAARRASCARTPARARSATSAGAPEDWTSAPRRG